MRITVFGASGRTGRLLVGQALAAGHRLAAVTRQPESFPFGHDRLEVIGADVLDATAVDAAVAGRTLYADMRRMEAALRASDLYWTVVRPGGLYHLAAPTGYTLVEGHADGRFTARADLAACLLALLDGDRYLRATVGVVTTVDNPPLLRWLRREAMSGA
ncbi:NAD(P)H-binding protein [Nocardia sp. NPDC050697]|uniref:NAD(P)H-binding protein n=1 Tax=Nocardia sp. NPDC050697 TaxID=3155158 RepID=UPI0033F13F5F